MQEWVTVSEYAKLSGRTVQSIYRSIKRNKLQTMTDADGMTLVSTKDIPDEPGTIPDVIPDTIPGTIPDTIPEPSSEPSSASLMPSYSQEYVDTLLQQIRELQADKQALIADKEELRADKDFFKAALQRALMPPETTIPDDIPDVQPDVIPGTIPDVIPEEPSATIPEQPKMTRWQHLKAFFKGD